MLEVLNPKYRDATALSSQFQGNEPFDHIVLDSFLSEDLANKLADQFPTPSQGVWWQYDNPLEKKFAFNDLIKLPEIFSEFFAFANSESFVAWLSVLSGLTLHADPNLLGGACTALSRAASSTSTRTSTSTVSCRCSGR